MRVLESTSLCYYTPLATLHNYPIISTHLKGISHVSKWNNILFVIINQQCWLSRVKCTVSTVFMKRVQPSLKYKMITQVTHFNDYLSFGMRNKLGLCELSFQRTIRRLPRGRLSRLSANILTTKFVMTKVDKTIIGSFQ